MTEQSIISNPQTDDNSVTFVSADCLNQLYNEITDKFAAVLVSLKTRHYACAQDFAVAFDLFETRFRQCHSPQQQLTLLNEYEEALK